MTRKDAAKHLNTSVPTISQWIKKGWAVLSEDGKLVNVDETKKLVSANKKPNCGGKRPKGSVVSDSGMVYKAEELDSDEPQSLEIPDGVTLNEARRLKEYWLSERARIEAQKLSGELISLQDAQKVYTDIIVKAKAQLEALPIRVSPLLVGKTDTIEIRKILQTNLDGVLAMISSDVKVGE